MVDTLHTLKIVKFENVNSSLLQEVLLLPGIHTYYLKFKKYTWIVRLLLDQKIYLVNSLNINFILI